jgi:signal transduction histidine kinase
MSIRDYVKGQIEVLISFVAVFIVMNMILFASAPLSKGLEDIFYLDLLIIIILLIGFSFNYKKIRKTYEEIQQAIVNESEMNHIFEKDLEVFMNARTMKMVLQCKEELFVKKEKDYQQKMNNLKDYITQTVHDIKVNLAVCEMVISRFEDEDNKVNKLIFQIEQMKFRINQALFAARVNHYSEDIVSEHVDIEKSVKSAINDNAEFFIHKGISIQIHIEPYSFISDTKWVQYIISQILNNCSKYTKRQGEVTIRSKEDAKGYYLHIKDNGIGIKKEEVSRVFDKGFTGENGRSNTKSTGMGMYYAKKIADSLGIDISIQSEKAVYTEFILCFHKLDDYINNKMS